MGEGLGQPVLIPLTIANSTCHGTMGSAMTRWLISLTLIKLDRENPVDIIGIPPLSNCR